MILRNDVFIGHSGLRTVAPRRGLQDVLAGRRRKHVALRRLNPAFPLKGVRRTVSNTKVTGSYSKGKMGNLCAYYQCPARGSGRLPADRFEGMFMQSLNRLHPLPEVTARFPQVLAKVWQGKQEALEERNVSTLRIGSCPKAA